VYVTAPTAGDVAVHVLVVLAQFVHVNDVGPFVHDATSVTLLPAYAGDGDDVTLHTGTATGGGVDVGEHIATGYGPGP
jgi:hypothetical protein